MNAFQTCDIFDSTIAWFFVLAGLVLAIISLVNYFALNPEEQKQKRITLITSITVLLPAIIALLILLFPHAKKLIAKTKVATIKARQQIKNTIQQRQAIAAKAAPQAPPPTPIQTTTVKTTPTTSFGRRYY